MEFIVHYWYSDWSHITGYHNGDPINEDELMQLVKDTRLNVMIHHNSDGTTHCFIDNKMFQQR